MSELFNNKYRIKSNRLQGYDYGSDGAYFITICTAKHLIEFGDIKNINMSYNKLGIIANEIWLKIPQKFRFIVLGEYIIMPNHVHGILIIDHDNKHNFDVISNNTDKEIGGRVAINRVSTNKCKKGGITGKKNPMLNQNISRVIRWYKGRVTYEIHKLYKGFAWQKNYYDRIIRNQKEMKIIEEYIRSNPEKWEDDKFFRT